MRRFVTFIAAVSVAVVFAADVEKVERRKPLTANVGVVSVGLDTYWKQCPGLLADMMKKEDIFIGKLTSHSVKVSRFGMSDNPQKAASLVPAMKAADLDILFIDMVTYATSSTFAPFVRELKCPIVLVALQPDSKLDYEKATVYKQLYNDDFCSVPEFTGVAVRYGKAVTDVVIGMLNGDAKADEEIRQWCAVAHVLHDLRRYLRAHHYQRIFHDICFSCFVRMLDKTGKTIFFHIIPVIKWIPPQLTISRKGISNVRTSNSFNFISAYTHSNTCSTN